MNYVQHSMLEPEQNASECGMTLKEFMSDAPAPLWTAPFSNRHNECYWITTVENKGWFELPDDHLTFLDDLPDNAELIKEEPLKPRITKENASYWARFDDATNRVVSTTREGERINRLTSGRTPELSQLYADFQNTDNKVVWLYENQDALKKYDVNVKKLLDIHGDS